MLKKIIEFLRKKYNECFFVGSTDKLPPPLSKEDELEYLKNPIIQKQRQKQKIKLKVKRLITRISFL